MASTLSITEHRHHTESHQPCTCVGSLIHRHRQLDDVIHPLCVLGFLWLLTHNPLFYQEPEGFRGIGPRATIPLCVKRNNDICYLKHWGERSEAEWDFNFTSTMFMKCNKNSCASCCRLVENSGWPRPTSALNIRGAMPIWSPCNQAWTVAFVRTEGWYEAEHILTCFWELIPNVPWISVKTQYL